MNKRMKLPSHRSTLEPPVWAKASEAFTLTELMTTVAIFSLVVIAMVSLQIFGFKMDSLTSSKLKSTADSLRILDQIRNQIRETTEMVRVGNYNVSNSIFIADANGQPAVGNAVQISNDPGNVITFYLNTNTGTLYELGDTTNGQPMALTQSKSIVNSQPFQKENCFGKTISVGSSDHYTVKMTLLFSNLVYSIPTPTYDTYRLESRATPREQD